MQKELAKKMVTKYIHIGYPKNLSTSLQRDFFGKHPQLMHLGIGCSGSNLGYIDDATSIAVEQYLRYAKDFVYNEKKEQIKHHFQKHFDSAHMNPEIKAVGLSGEHMGFNFTPDNIDISQKASRLHEIFGADTKVIMLVRNQVDLIKSLYNECIRVGYTKPYHEYIEYITMFYERNFASDFFYGHAYKMYSDLFGKGNICVIPMEEIRKSGKLVLNENGEVIVLRRLTDFLCLSYDIEELGHYNNALSQSVIVKTRELNATYPHDLGNIIFGAAESHRILPYFEKEPNIAAPFQARNDVLTKRKVIGEAIELAKKEPDLVVDYSCDTKHLEHLTNIYRQTNTQLSEMTGINFESLGYPCL